LLELIGGWWRKFIMRFYELTDEWICGPKATCERKGDADDVVFPCGWILKERDVYMYYGAADTCIALAAAKLSELVDFILSCPDHRSDSDWWKS
jgi:predicted GH43/DUF377 family glycosyl hydrolase